MTFQQLRNQAINYPIFKLDDIFKWFPQAKRQTLLNQISAWIKKGDLEEIRRGIYKIGEYQIKDCFILADFIYSPAYISLESALNYYSIIPEVPFEITCVSLNKTKTFKTNCCGVFSYSHLKSSLFFGFNIIEIEKSYVYKIALPEKALFDYLYLKARKIENPEGFIKEMRLSLPKEFNWQAFEKWSKLVIANNKNFHILVKLLLKHYA